MLWPKSQSLHSHFFGEQADPDDVHYGFDTIMAAVALTLDRFEGCKRFVVQDTEQTTGLCLDVYGVVYEDTGAVRLDAGYVCLARGDVTTDTVQQLQAASPDGGSTLMPITASAADINACAAELGVLADALPDAEAARLAGAGLLRATSVPLLKSTAARTVFPEAFKDVGNTHFKAGRMPEAVAGYTQAIESLQKCNGGAGTDVTECEDAAKAVGSVLYANRAAAYLGVQNDKDAKRKATGLEETAAQTDESEQAWDAKVAESIEAAAADARVAVACDPQNAKAHFRLGLAQFQLAERRQGSEADTQQLLTDAAASLATSDELKPNGVTKAKLAAAQKLLDEQVLAGVEPLQQ